ncbi:hypothetical protein NDU88_007050 [Pleurodeles waltl]|uniref:Uncharacterized protein n=1 Tax=Pleurodeles waltl TaxID=8319 RepID=A0AAV7UMT2_PLEWA|nr:hypothetical protein NDU88_007050 [Pleurodeles waltl]
MPPCEPLSGGEDGVGSGGLLNRACFPDTRPPYRLPSAADPQHGDHHARGLTEGYEAGQAPTQPRSVTCGEPPGPHARGKKKSAYSVPVGKSGPQVPYQLWVMLHLAWDIKGLAHQKGMWALSEKNGQLQ